jgi:hypothetical protein
MHRDRGTKVIGDAVALADSTMQVLEEDRFMRGNSRR